MHQDQNPWRRRGAFAAVSVAIVGLLAFTGLSQAREGAWGMHHGRAGGHMMDPAAMEKHLDAMVNKVLADGTAEQKAKVKDIAKAAMTDLHALKDQLKAGHQKGAALLTAATIDRTALESLRLDQMRLADSASQRIVKALADVAEVLTPAQRTKLAEHLKRHHH